jgi:hypothetical protein
MVVFNGMTSIPSFVKFAKVVQKLKWWTHGQHGDLISLHFITNNVG